MTPQNGVIADYLKTKPRHAKQPWICLTGIINDHDLSEAIVELRSGQ
jgi:hypothetical protein